MEVEPRNYRSFFYVERRLLMDYYPGKWGGLSEAAFKRYFIACASVRKYDNPYPWSRSQHTCRTANMSLEEYNRAHQELIDKHFIVERSDVSEIWNAEHPSTPRQYFELLILPDYINGTYRRSTHGTRTERRLKDLDRGYVLAPMILGVKPTRVEDGLLRNAPSTDSWAVILKMYEYNHEMWGGVDPNAIRMERGGLWVHPSICEELHLTVDELISHLCYWQRQDWMEFQPIQYRVIDTIGSHQIIFDGDGERSSNIYTLRLKYKPDRSWREAGEDD